MRVAVVGKGGTGKSMVAGTMARLLGRRGRSVLALDSDLMPGLALSLGAEGGAASSLAEAAERTESGRWRLRRGIGPLRAVQRFSRRAPDGVRLLEAGKLGPNGLESIMGSLNAFYAVVHRLLESKVLRAWDVVGDLPAGPRQAAFGWAPYADTFLVLAEPSWKAALTARRLARIARARPGTTVHPVATKVSGEADVRRVEDMLGESVFALVPADDAVREAERAGEAPIDRDGGTAATAAIELLVDRLMVSSSDR